MSSRTDDKRAPEERGYTRRSALDSTVEYVDLAEHVGLGVTIAHERSKPKKRDGAPRPPPSRKEQRRKIR